MSWGEQTKVAYTVRHPSAGTQAIGWTRLRDCGCLAMRGVRLDLREPTFGIRPCPAHHDECGRALLEIQTMPPSDREIFELACDLLDRQIAATEVSAS